MKKGVTENWMGFADDSPPVIPYTLKNFETMPLFAWFVSPDTCGEICEVYAANDSRIKVFHQKKNQGLSVARNTGIKMASADYLMFVDSDDVVHSDFCKVPYECAIKNQADLVMFKYKTVHFAFCTKMISKSQSFDVGCQKTQIEALDLLQGSIGHYVWNKLYKKTLFENITYPPGYIFEDWGTTYKTILKAKKIIYLDKILYYYCQHLGSMSSTKSEKVLKDSHELKMQQFHSLADWGYPAKQLDTFLLNTALSYCIKKKKDLSDPDYVFCWNVLQACDSIPKGFNGNRKILFSLFKYCPALFEMICVIWGKKCC